MSENTFGSFEFSMGGGHDDSDREKVLDVSVVPNAELQTILSSIIDQNRDLIKEKKETDKYARIIDIEDAIRDAFASERRISWNNVTFLEEDGKLETIEKLKAALAELATVDPSDANNKSKIKEIAKRIVALLDEAN